MRLLPLLPLVILAAPLPKPKFDETVEYLYHYGYLSTDQPSLHELRTALKVFQDVAGLPVTGEVDEATLEVQRRPRCAQPDTKKHSGRRKRFALASTSKWDKSHFTGEHELRLKWRVSKYTTDLKKDVIKSTIKKAFALWADQANIKEGPKVTFHFEEAAKGEAADIDILWEEGEHGDSYKFDGSKTTVENILAHTFFPGHAKPLNGDIHFDDAEQWEVDPEKMKVDSDRRFFPYVLAHEIGHALGLQHSRKADAVMNPYYSNTPLDELQLDVDDKCGINWNYVGPSNFCLFVWLMSEIISAQNNNSDFHQHSLSSSDHMLPGEKRVYTRRILKNVRIPRCTASNGLQIKAEKKLHRNLQLSADEARRNSEVVCNFLAGLHVYRGGPDYSPHHSMESEYDGVNRTVATFGVSSYKMRRHLVDRQQLTVADAAYFDGAFFDDFLPKYLEHTGGVGQ